MFVKLAVAAFLLAHGAIHASFISPRPPVTAGGPQWPFELGHSWLLSPLGVSPELSRVVGTALVAATIASFAFAAIVAVGVAPAALWTPALLVGVAASVALLVLFFHPWLVLGLAIDAALVWVAVSGYSPSAPALP